MQQNTAYPVVPIHTDPKYKLFNKLINLEQFHVKSCSKTKTKTKQIDFKRLARAWSDEVHNLFAENAHPDGSVALYYKIPEQLEHHHKVWSALQAEKATLVLSKQMRQGITTVLMDSLRCSTVLPAPSLPALAWTQTMSVVTQGASSTKGKGRPTLEKASSSVTGNGDISIHLDGAHAVAAPAPAPSTMAAVPAAIPQGQSEKTLGGSKSKRKRQRQCGICHDFQCVCADDCKGSGGAAYCLCNHEGPRPPRKCIHKSKK
jgi:hypothetical protein